MFDALLAFVTVCAFFNCEEVAPMRVFALRNLAISLCRSVLLLPSATVMAQCL